MLYLFLVESVISCERIEIHPEHSNCGLDCLCEKLNANVEFYSAVVTAYEARQAVSSFSYAEIQGTGIIITCSFDGGENRIHCGPYDNYEVTGPRVSVVKDSSNYYWTVNGELLHDTSGNRVDVCCESTRPRFKVIGNEWYMSLNDEEWGLVNVDTALTFFPDVTFSTDEDFLVCGFNDSLQLVLPTYILNATIKKGVPLQGFYKDVFMDAGYALTTRNSLYAATYLGYSLESVSCSNVADTAWQNTVIGGSAEDLNGRLLYPDGAPRYRMLFVCGGRAKMHGNSLREECRERMQEFVRNGGSYVGTCAGAFFATSQSDMYLHIWPGQAKQTGLSGSHTGMFVDEGSPLLRYYDFGGDNYVANIRHNGGCYALDWPTGTELLARVDYPQLEMHGKPSAWAYKKDVTSGRVIMEGSHPEEVSSGERRDFTAAMLRYAVDGVGETKIKGLLRNGEVRMMDKTTNDGNPEHTMIGDMQYHHFAVYIPQGAHGIRLKVASAVDCNLQLSLKKGNYAYVDGTEYQSTGGGAEQELVFDNLTCGLWYVAVQCLTTVTATNVTLGQEYSGRTDVLNGVPYTIGVAWD